MKVFILGDDLNFINSYNSDTGLYDRNLDITHGFTEQEAFRVGAMVKPYSYPDVQCGSSPCAFGPNDTGTINQFLHNSPVYGPAFNLPVFDDPTKWPQ